MPDVDLPIPFDSYIGKEPYIFVSYAHTDAALVYPEIQALHEEGYRIWYDEGIDPGNEWPDEIARALQNCAHFLVFLTPAAVASANVRNEINFAISRRKTMLNVYLVETPLPPGLELQIGSIQAVMAYRMSRENYRKKLGRALSDSLKRPAPPSSSPQPPPAPAPAPTRPPTPKPEPAPLPAAVARASAKAADAPKPAPLSPAKVEKELSPARPETGFVQHVDLGGGVTMNLVYIRGGTFTMGSPDTESGRFSGEGPQTRVTLTNDFWMGETPVTQAQWKAVMGSGNNPSRFKGDNLPVELVSWNEAMEFCRKLTEHGSAGVSPANRGPDGRAPLRFTLPTEAQWEYACRAGTTTRFSFGDSDSSLGDYAWYRENSGSKTQPVKTKKPNAWGLYDMHGNVWEWCLDWYADKLPGGSVTNPAGPSSGSGRVFRGGSWLNVPWSCRSADRNFSSPGLRHGILGFRAVAAVQ